MMMTLMLMIQGLTIRMQRKRLPPPVRSKSIHIERYQQYVSEDYSCTVFFSEGRKIFLIAVEPSLQVPRQQQLLRR